MTYIEMSMLISEQKEKVVSDSPNSIRTDKFLYVRNMDGEWDRQELPIFEDKFLPIPELEMPSRKTKSKKTKSNV